MSMATNSSSSTGELALSRPRRIVLRRDAAATTHVCAAASEAEDLAAPNTTSVTSSTRLFRLRRGREESADPRGPQRSQYVDVEQTRDNEEDDTIVLPLPTPIQRHSHDAATMQHAEAEDASPGTLQRRVEEKQRELDAAFPAAPPPAAATCAITPPAPMAGAAEFQARSASKVLGSTQNESDHTATDSVAGASLESDLQRGTQSSLPSRTNSRAQCDTSPIPSSSVRALVSPAQGQVTAYRTHPEARVALPAPQHIPRDGSTIANLFCADTVSTRYHLGSKIGEGTYGEVYIGYLKSDRSVLVALKRIKSLEGLDGFPLTSVREVIALQHFKSTFTKAQQRSFVLLREVLLSDDHQSVFLVFDFVEHSLAGLFARGRQFPLYLSEKEQDLGYIFLRILEGVDTLHKCNVMHRDLKLDNVLIDACGNVRLCDFGLSVPTAGERKYLTPSLINLQYRPPEMLLGSLTYDLSVDVWSVGCMLAQIILREPPFRVQDEARAGELAQLQRITEILGRVSELNSEIENSARRKFPGHAWEKCVQFRSGSNASHIPSQERRFSVWLKSKLPPGREPPSVALCDVLDAMLVVNSKHRYGVQQLLGMPFFTRIRNVVDARQRALADELKLLPSSHLMSVRKEMHDARIRQQGAPRVPQTR